MARSTEEAKGIASYKGGNFSPARQKDAGISEVNKIRKTFYGLAIFRSHFLYATAIGYGNTSIKEDKYF